MEEARVVLHLFARFFYFTHVKVLLYPRCICHSFSEWLSIYGEKYKFFMFCVCVRPLESFSVFTIFIYIPQNAFVCCERSNTDCILVMTLFFSAFFLFCSLCVQPFGPFVCAPFHRLHFDSIFGRFGRFADIYVVEMHGTQRLTSHSFTGVRNLSTPKFQMYQMCKCNTAYGW